MRGAGHLFIVMEIADGGEMVRFLDLVYLGLWKNFSSRYIFDGLKIKDDQRRSKFFSRVSKI